ncbi:MAG TPA: hypothetical protein PKH33_17335 [bacterium]|nr:hypothetical protein [bacterium]
MATSLFFRMFSQTREKDSPDTPLEWDDELVNLEATAEPPPIARFRDRPLMILHGERELFIDEELCEVADAV